MSYCRAALNTWWKLIQALADPRLDSEVRAGSATNAEVSPFSQPLVLSTTSLALSQLGLLEDGRLRQIVPAADRQKATVKVRITFDRLDPKILPDMGVKVAFLNEETSSKKSKKKDQSPVAKALIPQSAVRADTDGVYFAVPPGWGERRAW